MKTVRYIKHTQDSATFMPRPDRADSIKAYLDRDWTSDDVDRTSASGKYLIVGRCRLHRHSKTTGQHALCSGESDMMSMRELMKEAKLTHCNLEFGETHRCSCREDVLSQEGSGQNETSGRQALLAARRVEKWKL